MKAIYLTKSRFKLALECPTKLYYTGKNEYANQKIEDTFLLALADGGFQVGALAKCYFPGGYEIKTLDYDEALCQTNELLKKDSVIIFEAAVKFETLFIRADILIKNENCIKLVEVKAKSIDTATAGSFLNKNGSIASAWKPYLYDVAFQKHVVSCAFPKQTVSAYLMGADKNSCCPSDGLNQKFKIAKDHTGRKNVVVSPNLLKVDLDDHILVRVDVDEYCEQIYSEMIEVGQSSISFKDYVKLLADSYIGDKKIVSLPSSCCSTCEFKTNEQEAAACIKSGFDECWKGGLNWGDDDLKEPNVLDIWNFRKKDQCIHEGRIKLVDIIKEDISPKSDNKPGYSSSERQWLQVQKVQNNDTTHWFDWENMHREMSSWVYPLHFIDFETTMVAIPFNKGRHPYEGIAFQFSHHLVLEDGRIEHHGQYLNTTIGEFPNYDFLRKLKNELEFDQGSIFRYATHENTFLNIIYKQLIEDLDDIPDREELCEFVRTITNSVGGSEKKWEGTRNMIDMCEIVKRYYYNPATKGSNSIKQVLPALLNSSRFLKKKYSAPIYGAEGGIPSLNYKDWKWIKFKNGRVIDPYKLMPNMFQDISQRDFVLLSDSDKLNNGGAALTAYARIQFEEMSEYERSEIRQALLKYCELDTLAMVMIYEGWKELINIEMKRLIKNKT